MSAVGEAFLAAFGKPDPAAPNGIAFYQWKSLYTEIGAGWFKGGFLYLFGDGMAFLTECLDAWPFLVPPCDDRIIVGRNAYGAILVLEHAHTPEQEQLYVLDPFTVTYETRPNLLFRNLIGRWLPQGLLTDFLDDRAYRQWLAANEVDTVDLDEVLGIKIPQALGGELVTGNMQLGDIVDYYRTTAPIYAEAFATPPA
ncbi:hypothetical protein J5X84_28105 [Streptosporangiaceae bacterium NEAU-GS5]|nr:hypothetical protein [Streptosporangiaceae bacterium NEAU-GS5]